MTQDKIIELIIGSEKGLNEQEPVSVGGVSYDGVTQKTYDAYLPRIRETVPQAPQSVRDLDTRPPIVEKFYELYLGDFHVWILPEFLQYIYGDFVVNAGAAAVKIIQRLAGCDVDGVFGPGTRAAVKAWAEQVNARLKNDASIDNDLIMEFHAQKLEHYDKLVAANPDKFGKWHKGWLRRANHVLSELQEYFETDEGTPSAMADTDVPVVPAPETKKDWGTQPDRFINLQRQVNELDVRLTKLENARKFGG